MSVKNANYVFIRFKELFTNELLYKEIGIDDLRVRTIGIIHLCVLTIGIGNQRVCYTVALFITHCDGGSFILKCEMSYYLSLGEIKHKLILI